jgi:4-amino-4-deoxy-L-arabinose transferase-like glycosyltransferase
VKTAKRFYLSLGGVVAAGLAIRIAYAVIWKWDQRIWGDALYYHEQGHAIAEGLGFIDPYRWRFFDEIVPNAEHPPVYSIFLAGAWLVGLASFHSHMILNCILGALTVGVTGLIAREVGGNRVGIIAAAVAAVYANLFVHDALVTSESITGLAIAVMVLLAYRFWKVPNLWTAAFFGLATGVAVLTRAEVVLVIPLVALPIVLRVRGADAGRKLALGGLVVVMTAVPVLPWVYRNMTTFEHQVVLSTGGDTTLANTNCDETYYGDFLGWFYLPCNGTDRSAEHSQWALDQREKGLDYIRSHTSRLPVVLLARVGRMWELYRPLQKNHLDVKEGRELWAARLGMVQFYVLVPLAIWGGVVVGRRKRVPLFPLLALPVIATVAALVAFGNTRYRIPAEIAIVVLAAVGIDQLWDRWRGANSAIARSDVVEPAGEPQAPVRVPAEAGTRSR